MKVIRQKVEYLEQKDLFKHIELCGRTCYKSEDKITDNSYKGFIDMIVKSGHLSVLEHGTIYLKVPKENNNIITFYENNQYSRVVYDNDYVYITTNYRVIIENNRIDDMKYETLPCDKHKKRYIFKLITNRAIANEFVRHRVFSYSQASTRYCNYSKDKFGNEITFIEPIWLYNNKESREYRFWQCANQISESYYFQFLDMKQKPEQARGILTLDLATELVMTGFKDDWDKFFELRCNDKAHPQAKELAELIANNSIFKK